MSKDLREKEHLKQYWNGNFNKGIRYWFYISRGLDLFNNFRYVFMLIFGIYFTLKLHNYGWLVAMFVIIVPVLGGIGYLSVHYMGKVMDWLNIKFSTHYGKYQYELLEQQIELLTNIEKKLEGNRQITD